MRLLIDHNLPHSLVRRLADLFPGSASVSFLGLATAPDAAIWTFARDQGYVLVTQDLDFADDRRHPGPPPKVILIDIGNATPAELEDAIRLAAPSLEAFARDDQRSIIVH